ncbi:hypothetical protein [Chondromyces crocatus]|uniref:Uncharacterized protein n=1 Tax=Chondromyces crocatus TaxID=52 RepID=A0A0K1EGX6_CHOCO|nr:hypothetical protein [Chondromyces crocatus]AKT40111.1 uncharacterized protein CMC5_042640 [Chondromyces crocatus]
MSDRSCAEIFGKVFTILAEHPTEERMAIARKVWHECQECEFTPDQMFADEALVVLGLARLKEDPRHPEHGDVWLYGPEAELSLDDDRSPAVGR